MKRKLKNKLIILLLALVSLFILGGCSLSRSLEEILNTYEVNPQVTYYANGGVFEDSSAEKNMYFKIGSKAMNIGMVSASSSHKPKITRDGYKFLGWYHVALDEQGQPLFEDETADIYQLGDPVDFTKALEQDEHWIIAAKWQALVGVKVMMVCDEGETVEVGEAKDGLAEGMTSFVNGDEIGELNYDSKNQVAPYSATPESKFFTVKDDAFTFLGYYMDVECTTPVPVTLTRGEENITIYARYLTGEWTLVDTKTEVIQMFTGLGQNKNYWLAADVDCGNSTVSSIGDFKGVLQGGGHTISNLNVKKTLKAGSPKAGVFGNLTETAKIENITFENLTVEYTLQTAFHAEVYFVFLSRHAEAVVNNVTIKGTLSTNGPNGAVVDNLVDGDGNPRYDHCLYGGYDTDSAYTGGGFTVELTQVNGVAPNN